MFHFIFTISLSVQSYYRSRLVQNISLISVITAWVPNFVGAGVVGTNKELAPTALLPLCRLRQSKYVRNGGAIIMSAVFIVCPTLFVSAILIV